MTPHEICLGFYWRVIDSTGWTIKEIDNIDISTLLDLFNVRDKLGHAREVEYIDNIL